MKYRGNTILTLLLVLAAAMTLGSAVWAGAPTPTPATVGMKAMLPHDVIWAATVTHNNKIYYIGGYDVRKPTDGDQCDFTYVQIYDPATNTWSEGAPMPTKRRLPGAAVVNGKIYVSGGRNTDGPVNAHEAYDIATNTWTQVKRTPDPIRGHACAAHNGKIYLFGGNTGLTSAAYQRWVKIYDPATDAWTNGKDMPIDRGGVAYGGAVAVPGLGKIVYVTGDKGATGAANYIGKSYVYDPAANAWENDKTLNTPIKINQFSIACDSTTNKVYTFGGQYWEVNANPAADQENPYGMVLDCNTWTWNTVDNMPASEPSPADRFGGGAGFVQLPGETVGKIYQMGGSPAGDLVFLNDEYVPATDTWYQPNAPSAELRQGTQTNAVGTKIYSIGGWYDGGANGQVIVYDTVANAWSTLNSVDPHPRMSGVSAVWNGKIVLSGGDDGDASVGGDTQLYDPATDTFTALPADPVARSYAFGAVVGNTLYVFGGNDLVGDPGTLASVSALDLNAKTWSAKANMPVAIESATAQAFNGKIYIIGGYDGLGGATDDMLHNNVLIYDPAANTFTEGAAMPYATYLGASGVWGNYLIQDSGYHLYIDPESGNRYAEMSQHYQFYEPATDTWYDYQVRGWGRAYHGSAVVGNKLYSMLGASWNYLVERLDILNMGGGTVCDPTCTATVAATGTQGVDVIFQATAAGTNCTGQPTYAWDYGDGTQGVGNNTTHAYAAAGTYNWSMTATIDGKTCTKTGSITIAGKVCSVTCTATVATSGTTAADVIFVATATGTDCTGQPTYAWDYGDGVQGQGNNTTHRYTAAGTFNWSMTATIDGKTCTKTGTITITQPDVCTLTCDATVATTGVINQDVIFFATATKSAACVGEINYAWNYGDGNNGVGNNTTHAYTAVGSYNWSVTVTVDNQTCTKTGTVVISDVACTLTCNANVATSGQVGVDVIFFATGTKSDACVGNIGYAWNYGDGATGEGNNTTHAYAAAGSYNWSATITVDNETCTKSGTVVITDGNAPAFTMGSVSGKNEEIVKVPMTLSKSGGVITSAGFDLTYDSNFLTLDDQTSGGGTIHDYGVELPQAMKDLGFSASKSLLPNNLLRIGILNMTGVVPIPDGIVFYLRVKINAGVTGETTIANLCTASDGQGNSIATSCVPGTVSVTVIKCEVTCTAAASVATAKIKTPVTFTATAEKNADCVGPLSQQWSFGDGTTSTELVATHTYEKPGIYTWTFTASADDQSCTKTGTITVNTGLKVKLDWAAPPVGAQCAPASNLTGTLIRTEVLPMGIATFTMGSVSGRNEEIVKVPMTLSESGGVITSAGFDLTYDSNFLTLDDQTSGGGTIHDYGVELPQAMKDLGFSASKSLLPNNLLRIGILNMTGVVPIPDGIVFYLRVKINAGVTGETTIANLCTASDGQGNSINTTCVEGKVGITQDPVLLGFDVFRGTTENPSDKLNTDLLPPGTLTFMDENPPLGMVYYCVKAVWGNCTEAPVCSNVASVRVALCEIKSCTATATPTSGFVPLAVTFSAGAVTDGCTETPSYAWSFGDGAAATTQNAAHVYQAPGTYHWTMVVTVQGQVCTFEGTVTADVDPPHVTNVKKVTNPFRVRVDGTNFHQASMKVYIAGQTTAWANIKWKTGYFFIKGAGSYFPKTDTWTKIRLVNGDDTGETTVEYNRKLNAWRPAAN